jgi:hypothetical protein
MPRKALDHLLVRDDLVVASRQLPVDAFYPERMVEGDDFASGPDGHAPVPFAYARSRKVLSGAVEIGQKPNGGVLALFLFSRGQTAVSRRSKGRVPTS